MDRREGEDEDAYLEVDSYSGPVSSQLTDVLFDAASVSPQRHETIRGLEDLISKLEELHHTTEEEYDLVENIFSQSLPLLLETIPFLDATFAQIEALERHIQYVSGRIEEAEGTVSQYEEKLSTFSLKKLIPSFLREKKELPRNTNFRVPSAWMNNQLRSLVETLPSPEPHAAHPTHLEE